MMMPDGTYRSEPIPVRTKADPVLTPAQRRRAQLREAEAVIADARAKTAHLS